MTRKFQQFLAEMKEMLNITFYKAAVFLLVGIVMFALMYSNVKPKQLNIDVFTVAEETIRAPITIEDKYATEQKKKQITEEFSDVYVLKKEVAQNRVDLITSIFDTATEVNEEVATMVENQKKLQEQSGELNETPIEEPDMAEKIEMYQNKLSNDIATEISTTTYTSLLNASKIDLELARDITVTAIHKTMSDRIPSDEVENSKKKIEEELRLSSISNQLKPASIELGRLAIYPNEFYDPTATEEALNQKLEEVETVKIYEGQILVEAQQLITRDIYRQLEVVGLLDTENSIQPIVGLGLLIFVLMGAMYSSFYSKRANTDSGQVQSHLLIFVIIFLLALIVMKGTSLLSNYENINLAYIFPVAFGSMMIKVLINDRLAIVYTILLAVCGSIIYNTSSTGTLNAALAIYILCSGLAGVYFLAEKNQRSKMLLAGTSVSVINVILIFSILFISNGKYDGVDYILYLLIGGLSGILSAVLAIGLLPFFEASFNIVSNMRLIELSSPNHPLLKKILVEAPGTYHHSIMVANLAENAAEAIGANSLLARVGCYYHDIGKTVRPSYFIENQIGKENPHDKLPAEKSKEIIISHAIDGAEILRKNKMPQEIIDIAEQHHGTTFLKYFYYNAKNAGIDVSEDDFRYPGPKPQTKEVVIIGIADSVEAAVRSMENPTPEAIEKLVKNIINERLQDGQFDECDITLKELNLVAKSLCATLNGIFHSRIEYPELKK